MYNPFILGEAVNVRHPLWSVWSKKIEVSAGKSVRAMFAPPPHIRVNEEMPLPCLSVVCRKSVVNLPRWFTEQ